MYAPRNLITVLCSSSGRFSISLNSCSNVLFLSDTFALSCEAPLIRKSTLVLKISDSLLRTIRYELFAMLRFLYSKTEDHFSLNILVKGKY